MALGIERLNQLAQALVDARRRQIALNRACAHKSANFEKPTAEELEELRAARSASEEAHEALIEGQHNGLPPRR